MSLGESRKTGTIFASFDTDVNPNYRTMNDDHISIGLELYYQNIFCPVEVMKLYDFLQDLLSHETPRAIIQGVMNTIVSPKVKSSLSKNLLTDLYHTMDTLFNIQMGKIMLAIKSLDEIKNTKEWVFC